jgi:hypothetical protein
MSNSGSSLVVLMPCGVSSAIEPGVLHAPLVVGAVDPDRDPLDLRI